MAKIVCYNGKTESYYGCTEPNVLIYGKKYEVISENDRGWQTDYILKGVKGHFNSCWFDEVSSVSKTFMALAHHIPEEGKSLKCYIIEFDNSQTTLNGVMTSTVKEVRNIGNNIYNVTTQNNTYIVQVG